MNQNASSFIARVPIRPKAAKRGQESVWDYPRPPRLERSTRHIKVVFNGRVIAETSRAFRMLETSHPPVYYIPPQDVDSRVLSPSPGTSYCEWKGRASYFSISYGDKATDHAVWTYKDPKEPYGDIAGYFAFYPSLMDRCTVDGEIVKSQSGDFYGGWITRDVVGPFKGPPGTHGW
jgi:uncharacterized protein (DUF427 family)